MKTSWTASGNAFLEQFDSESNRGAALIALAYLDNLLEDLFRARTVDEEQHVKKLLSYPGPLSTTNARADVAYALGWIGPQVFMDLSTVRKIRNKFAHSYEGFDFESDSQTMQLCKNLKAAEFAGVRLRTNRDRFLISVMFLGLQLQELCNRSEKPGIGNDPPIKTVGPPQRVQ